MPHVVKQPMSSMLINGAMRFAHCWKVERRDGVVLRFTDHSTALVVQGETYEPAGGFEASARQKQKNLNPQNVEIRGAISSDAISHDDLRAGKYRRAMVTEMLVDWRFPFEGEYDIVQLWVTETRFNAESWQTELQGLASFLQNPVGGVYTRKCEVDLGSPECGVDLDALSIEDVPVTSVQTERRLFKAASLAGVYPDGWFAYGEVRFTTGQNNGSRFEIKRFRSSDGRIQFQIRSPYDIVVGDEFKISPGCNKLSGSHFAGGHCKHKYDNIINFRAYPHIPGNDKTLTIPDPK